MKIIIFSLLLVLLSLTLLPAQQGNNHSQNGILCKLSGTVVDADSGTAITSVTVKLVRPTDSSIAAGAISDIGGNFEIKNITPGKYILRINYLGYRDINAPIVITEKKPARNIGKIKMTQTSLRTQGIEVTADREMIQTSVDKKVYNVEKNLTTAGGSALDVMKTVPSIDVDIDGNISLRGNQNVQILIDGKPSGIANSDLLDMLPASTISSVEVITNPSAKYEAQGTSGIINIVLKTEKEPGFNGMASINAGTGDKYNGSLNLNYYTGIFNFTGSYNGRIMNNTGYSNVNQTNNFNNSSILLNQHDNETWHGGFQNFKFGTDVTFNENNKLNFSIMYSYGVWHDGDSLSNRYPYSTNDSNAFNTRNSKRSFPNHSMDLDLGYKLSFDKKTGHELSADLFYSPAERDFNTDYSQGNYISSDSTRIISTFPYQTVLQNSKSYNTNHNFTFQLDYKLPFYDGGLFESGFKSSQRYADMNFQFFNIDSTGKYINDTNQTNDFVYNEKIQAAYAIYSNSIGLLKYQFGLRAEYSSISSDQKTTNENHNSSYLDWFPSAFLKYDLGQDNYFLLNYSRRINRPDYRSLNPFINYEDPRNLSSGNPLLNPEYVHSLELRFNGLFGKTEVTPEIYFKSTGQSINRVTQLIDSITTLTRPLNISQWQNFGSDITVSGEITSWWKYDFNLNYYRTVVTGQYQQQLDTVKETVDLSSDRASWAGKFNTYFNVYSNFDIQFSGYYRSPVATAQGNIHEVHSFDLALKLSLFDKKANISLRCSDIFNTLITDNEAFGSGFYKFSERKR
ncbi:MAG: TonB-dependent receptor, partial [FCB group bacterium]